LCHLTLPLLGCAEDLSVEMTVVGGLR
jgi:hypothetical protein